MSADTGLYLDSSALSKLYVAEPESALVERLLQSSVHVMCSTLAQAEFASMLHRKVREGAPPESVGEIWKAFQQDLKDSALTPVETTAQDIHDAVSLLKEHGAKHLLRTLDAIHLASARNLGADAFLTFDHRQRETALFLGFRLPSLG